MIYRAQVIVPASSGITKDSAVNTWGFNGSATDTNASVMTAITAPLRAFYDGWANYRSFMMNWPGARLKVYNMGDAMPRVPIGDVTLGLSATVPTTTLPTEVTICLSFQAARVSGQSQRRRRGRVYLGPLAQLACVSSTGRPLGSMMTTMAASAETFRTSINATSVQWGVISQPHPLDPLGFAQVTGGWIDDAFDTQRRRGPVSSTRTIFGS